VTTYKGYTGVFSVDPDANVIRGKVVDLKDTITFQGATVAEAVQAFRDSVDDYLKFCESLGEQPERPFSGSFLVRIKPQVHRGLTALAQSKGVSLNQLVVYQLTRLAHSRTPALLKIAASRAGGKPKDVPKATFTNAPKATFVSPPKAASGKMTSRPAAAKLKAAPKAAAKPKAPSD
jgi:predicted HicB family RNase H-like nuclease